MTTKPHGQMDFLAGSTLPLAGRIPVLPISVLPVKAQRGRKNEHHDADSSRANYSPFPAEVADLCLSLFLKDAGHVFDPFAGWGDRHAKAKAYGIAYTGWDISPEAVEVAEARGLQTRLADSEADVMPWCDAIFTCPPYWDLEAYASPFGLDKAETWDDFQSRIFAVWERCFHACAPGGTWCVLVGDWRKDGRLYDLTYRTQAAFDRLGLVPFDSVVVDRSAVTKIKVMIPQAVRLGYTVKCHETLLVYRKP